MKLSVSLDLSPARIAAEAQVDVYFAKQVSALSNVPTIHALKLLKAQAALAGGTPDPQLVAEAAGKGLTVAALCSLVVDKATAMNAAIMMLETARQAAKAQIAAATTQQAITLIQQAHQ